MPSDIERYGRCPTCCALNMAHRQNCYRCRKPLPASFWQADRAQPPLEGRLPHKPFPNKRRYPRREVYIPRVMLEGEGIVRHFVTVRNISAGGLQIRTTIPCRVGTQVWLYLPLEGHIYKVEGIVRHGCPVREEQGRIYAYGIEFISLTPLLHRLVGRMV